MGQPRLSNPTHNLQKWNLIGDDGDKIDFDDDDEDNKYN